MKRNIIPAALVAAVLVIPTAASASPYLSMSQGKHRARADVYRMIDGDSDYQDAYLTSCWRNSRSAIACNYRVETYDGITCGSTVRERLDSYGYFRLSFGHARCWPS
jgi:hypothetical protein